MPLAMLYNKGWLPLAMLYNKGWMPLAMLYNKGWLSLAMLYNKGWLPLAVIQQRMAAPGCYTTKSGCPWLCYKMLTLSKSQVSMLALFNHIMFVIWYIGLPLWAWWGTTPGSILQSDNWPICPEPAILACCMEPQSNYNFNNYAHNSYQFVYHSNKATKQLLLYNWTYHIESHLNVLISNLIKAQQILPANYA